MRLNDDEKRMLDGEHGRVKQKCMQFLLDYGEAAGAEKLIDVDGTVDLHPGQWWVPEYAVTLEELGELVNAGERFKVPTFANKATAPGFICDGWENCGTSPNSDPEFHKECMDSLELYIKMGLVPTYSCTNYLVSSYWPTLGQHCAWVESSAIPWVNAILGARSNFDGCFETAYLGKVPAYDMHLDENRAATVLVKCEGVLSSDMDYDLFGWAVGEAVGLEVPALLGVGHPTTTQLVKMNSTLNTGGQVRMYHIPGFTPEAPSLEAAFHNKPVQREVVIQREDLRRVYEKMNYASTDSVDFVYLGCPHYNISELQQVAHLLQGRKCRASLWVMTNPLTFKAAEMMGIRAAIEESGGTLLSGTCPGLLQGEMPEAAVMATDAVKQDYYITGIVHPKKLEVWYGSTADCIDAAVTGKWRGEWR